MAAKSAVERAQAEAKTKAGYETVDLEGLALHVLPPMEWRASAVRAMADNNYDVWAEGCLSPESYAAWQSIDPTIRQCEEFFVAWRNRTGQDVGESAAS